MLCKNCSNPIDLEYCPKCGQRILNVPYTFKTVYQWIAENVDYNRGYFYTFGLLMAKPHKLIFEFLGGRTKDFVNPVTYFLTSVALYITVVLVVGIVYPQAEGKEKEVDLYMIILPFSAGILMVNLVAMRKKDLNLVSHVSIALYECSQFIYFFLITALYFKFFSNRHTWESGRNSIGTSISEILWQVGLDLLLIWLYHIFFSYRLFGGKLIKTIAWSFLTLIISVAVHVAILHVTDAE